ncbi:hypothetical protein PG989_002017 [Apiospora arundinis]
MAERLSEDPNVQVAVIEAGTFYELTDPLYKVPAEDGMFVGSSPQDTNPLVDWNFVTEPQSGANGRKIHYARGKCLGGSSARNYMVYQRGTVQAYQKWADAVNDSSYTWDNWLPFFQKSVQFRPPSATRATNASAAYNISSFSLDGGPLEVGYPNWAQPFASWVEPSLNEIGVPTIQDFNSGSLLGCQYCSTTIDHNMERDSSETSFGNLAFHRANLDLIQFALAKKIHFDDTKRANALTYQIGLLEFTATARREVILSAGAFQSPQLLMVSGIGPAAALKRLNIPVISDRPGVGQGMQDHVFFGPTWRVNVQTLTRLANDPSYVAAQLAEAYDVLKQGPLTNPLGDFIGWEKVPRKLLSTESDAKLNQTFPPDWPELEIMSMPAYIGNWSDLSITQPEDGYQYATLLGALVAPLSRGSVTITSDDTNDLPLINPNWLSDPTDTDVAIATYKRLRAIFETRSMQGVLAGSEEYFPGAGIQSDDQILDTIRDTVMTVWHASCTCRMGRSDDITAVVDSHARVYGVRGLRVVDASSFALLPPGHPQSTVYALAEKVATQIRAGDTLLTI